MTISSPHGVRRKDKRSSRTRKALAEAMFRLLEKTEFQKVTVNDICAQAEVSRPTFYTYFDDKFSLLRYCIEVFYTTVVEDAVSRGGSHRDILTAMMDQFEHKSKAFRCLLLGETNRELANLIQNSVYDLNYNAISMKSGQDIFGDVPLELLALFRSGGSISVLTWWLNNERVFSKKEMVEYLLELNGSPETISDDHNEAG